MFVFNVVNGGELLFIDICGISTGLRRHISLYLCRCPNGTPCSWKVLNITPLLILNKSSLLTNIFKVL